MKEKYSSPLIFFDATCPFCRHSVQKIIHLDRKKIFLFAPLEGETANLKLIDELSDLKQANTLVLLENPEAARPRVWTRAKALFRIFWILKGKWRLIGWLCFFPFGADYLYQIVAHFRHRIKWKKDEDKLYLYPDRFLP